MPRAALVTGAGQRIGRALALELGRLGAAVAVHHNASRAAAEAVVREIVALGGRAVAVTGDLADADDAMTLAGRAAAAVGPLDCLVNNASIFERDEWDTVTPESWAAHLDVNLRAPMLLIQAFARQLPAAPIAPPPDLRGEELCLLSYLRPLDGCPTYIEYFKDGDEIPSRLCPIHSGSFKQQAQRAVQGLLTALGEGLKAIFR